MPAPVLPKDTPSVGLYFNSFVIDISVSASIRFMIHGAKDEPADALPLAPNPQVRL